MYRHRPTEKKKEELVDLFFTNGIVTQNITSVIDQHTYLTGCFLKLICSVISYPHLINVHTLLCHINSFQVQSFWQSTILWLLELVPCVMKEEYKISNEWIGLSGTLKLEMCNTNFTGRPNKISWFYSIKLWIWFAYRRLDQYWRFWLFSLNNHNI